MAADQNSIGEKAAGALSLRLGSPLAAPVGERPLALAWRAEPAGSGTEGQGNPRALFVVRPDAPEVERKRFVAAAERVARLSASGLPAGVLRVHAVSPEHEAVVTDLLTMGCAKDLGALAWSAARRVEFVRRVALVLEGLHGAGIVHGCLCEENVLLDDDLAPVLAEAGAVSVRLLAERGGDVVSYVAFAAPEMLEGAEGDARGDVYSIGRLLQHVFRADELPQVTAVVRRCVAPSPAGRFPTAGETAAALAALTASLGTEVKPVAPPPPRSVAQDAAAEREAAAVATSLPPSSRRLPPPSLLGPVGGGFITVALVVASLGIGSSSAAQTLLTAALVCGVAMVTYALRPRIRTPESLRIGFSVAAAGLVIVTDPLSYVYRSAAERAMRASPEARRAAIDQVIRLGRDFRNMGLGGLDLSGADLRGADLRGADLSQSDLSRADLAAAMVSGASLIAAKLTGADLRQTDLRSARLESATCDARTMLPAPFHCVAGLVSDTPLQAPPAGAIATPPVRAAEPAPAPAPPSLEGGQPPR